MHIENGYKFQRASGVPVRGRHKSEAELPNLEADIRALVEAQADPKFQSTFAYAHISPRAVREALVKEKGYEVTLPTVKPLARF